MRKLAPAQVSHQYGFLMLCHFISRLFEGTLHVDTRAIQNREYYACATHSSPLVDRFHMETGGELKESINLACAQTSPISFVARGKGTST